MAPPHHINEILPRTTQAARDAEPLFSIRPGAVLQRDTVTQLQQITALRTQLEGALERARREGYEAGVEEVLSRCALALRGADELAKQHLEARANDILKLAIAVAERILHDTIAADPERWRDFILETFSTLSHEEHVEVIAGEHTLSLLEDMRARLERRLRGIPLVIRHDKDAAPWALRVEVPGATLELGIEHQLGAIARAWGVEEAT